MLEKQIKQAVRETATGRVLSDQGVEDVTGAALSALRSVLGVGVSQDATPAKTVRKRKTTTASKAAVNKAKGRGAALRGAVRRLIRDNARPGDEKLVREGGEKSIRFAESLAESPAEQEIIENIVNGRSGQPSGFPATES